MTEDPKISQRYRELPREEPPRYVDEAILAAARRAAETRPAPLVVPTGRQRWYFPLAAAAIIVLAVAVTMHVERQQPDPETFVVAPVTTPEAPAKEEAAAPRTQETAKSAPPRVFTPDPKPAPRDTAPLADLQRAPSPAPAAVPPPQDAVSGAREAARASAEREAAARADAERAAARQAKAMAEARRETTAGAAAKPELRGEAAPADAQRARAAAPERAPAPQAKSAPLRRETVSDAVASFAALPPEQVLQGIADLRRQGRHEEADKALAEFRKRYPDYRIPEAMLEKVEKR